MSASVGSQRVDPIPAEYGAVTPWVIVRGAARFIDFATDVFGGEERFPPVLAHDGETIAHAEIQIGDSVVMVFDSEEDWPPTPAFLNLYVEDCDTVHRRALEAGAVEVTGLSTSAWGDRGSRLRDPFGNLWWVQTRVEDVPEEEIERRMAQPHHLADLEVAAETLRQEMRRRA